MNQENLERNTPKKVIEPFEEHTARCPNCNRHVRIIKWCDFVTDKITEIEVLDNFCSHCGQKLEGINMKEHKQDNPAEELLDIIELDADEIKKLPWDSDEFDEYKDALNDLRKLLRRPTPEEVCEILKGEYEMEFRYNKETDLFELKNSSGNWISYYDEDGIQELVTLGKFYMMREL